MALRFCFILILLSSFSLYSQDGHEIEVELVNYESSKLVLGYQYGNKQFIKDTVDIDDSGIFTFQGDEPLGEGIFLLVMLPDNKSIQFMVDEENQYFKIALDTQDSLMISTTKFENSTLNESYYTYLNYLHSKSPEKMKLQDTYLEVKDDPIAVEKLKDALTALDNEVKAYHEVLIKANEQNLLGRLVKSRIEPDIPLFEGDNKDQERYLYYKEHYFDNLDLKDEGLIRTGALSQRMDYYMKSLTVQIPDSINQSLDYLLSRTEGSNNFKYILQNYLNEYVTSNQVGMDAVYVHLVDNYYAKGKADWASAESIEKMIETSDTWKPILIGQTAPNVAFKTKEKQTIALHDLASDYTVLFFWDPECGHCKKAMPDMLAFHDQYQPKGVEVLGVCTQVGTDEDMEQCWKTIEEKEMGRWVNVSDQYLQSNYKEIYDIKSTPRIFILDSDKKIVMKGIGASQLSDVMEQILIERESQSEEGK